MIENKDLILNTLPEDVVADLQEKQAMDSEIPEQVSSKLKEETVEDISLQNALARHHDILKKKEFKQRALEKEIKLKGVSPEELAERPQLLEKYNRKVKKLEQQIKKDSHKKARREAKLLEKSVLIIEDTL